MSLKFTERVNEFFATLVVIIDEMGARCISCVPKDIAKKGYLVQNHHNGVVTCTKIFKPAKQAEELIVNDMAEKFEIVSANYARMKSSIGPFERETHERNFRSKSHRLKRSQYPRQDEVTHFHQARQAEQLATTIS